MKQGAILGTCAGGQEKDLSLSSKEFQSRGESQDHLNSWNWQDVLMY